MLTYRTLENTAIADLHKAFSMSFTDYRIPMNLTISQFEAKLHNEGVDLTISGGAYDYDELIGLILHARGNWNGQSTAYNAGTGVY